MTSTKGLRIDSARLAEVMLALVPEKNLERSHCGELEACECFDVHKNSAFSAPRPQLVQKKLYLALRGLPDRHNDKLLPGFQM